ncbi:hypothetical protein PYCCODRAFT_858455 [Trametes coccinea BRFM310]|uniref:Uncharacterized protein n=1 Tax=Trametes coccinea (strain BRFM310) TaxID=1353009 RepID=A0A1Y2IGC2_TRAC3|nr:hypothetical protein PYCCODRAFT_858455 [Trametes coccinea BRFM310]
MDSSRIAEGSLGVWSLVDHLRRHTFSGNAIAVSHTASVRRTCNPMGRRATPLPCAKRTVLRFCILYFRVRCQRKMTVLTLRLIYPPMRLRSRAVKDCLAIVWMQRVQPNLYMTCRGMWYRVDSADSCKILLFQSAPGCFANPPQEELVNVAGDSQRS